VVANGDHWEHGFREGHLQRHLDHLGHRLCQRRLSALGAFPVVLFFFIGLIGGCAGSTACSVKIFRYQLLFASISRPDPLDLRAPRRVRAALRRAAGDRGRPVLGDGLLRAVLRRRSGSWSVLLGMTGLDFVTSVSGAATAREYRAGPGRQ
jgi:trk system potassium uptake protein TrkH